jgi:hypothetical protein
MGATEEIRADTVVGGDTPVSIRRSAEIRYRTTIVLWFVIVTSVVYIAGLAEYARVRPIDEDEGFSATAARLVWEGKAPYRDFFYQQTPLLPYLYSWIWAVRPHSLVAMRLVSAFCGAAAVLLWGLALIYSKRFGPGVALATFLALVLSPTWMSWSVVVKTFSAANLLMTIAIISLYAALRVDNHKWYFVSGLALGLCASVRAFYGPLIPAILLWYFCSGWRGSKFNSRPLAFLAGSLFGTAPILWYFVRDPRAFVFNNIRYHNLDTGWITFHGRHYEGYVSFGHVAYWCFAVLLSIVFLHPYFSIECIVAAVGGASLLRMRKTASGPYSDRDYAFFRVIFLLLVIYVVVAWLPFPSFDQYFVTPLVPFGVPFLAEGVRVCLASKRSVAVLALAVPAAFAFELAFAAHIYSDRPVWRFASYDAVTHVVNENSSPDDVVLSFWPGYVFESGRKYFPDFENEWTSRVMSKVTPLERTQFHVVSKDRVLHAISHQEVKLVVVHPAISDYYLGLTQDEMNEFLKALARNYVLAGTVGEVQIYRRISVGPSSF